MTVQRVQAVYRKGALRLAGRLPLPENAKVVITWRQPADAVERTRGILRVPRRVMLELTTPHHLDV